MLQLDYFSTGYTISHDYVTETELQRLEKKASFVLQSCLIDKSSLRVIEKIGQGNVLIALVYYY